MSLDHPSGSSPQGRPREMPGLSRAEIARNAIGAVSNEVAELYLVTSGRGPTRVRTYIQPEFCVCVLSEILTDAERALVERGAAEVDAARTKINEGIEAELVAIVERQAGRPVLSHLVRLKVLVEVAVHFFLFDDGPAPSQVHH
jgi:uncharacterized protein YbcI